MKAAQSNESKFQTPLHLLKKIFQFSLFSSQEIYEITLPFLGDPKTERLGLQLLRILVEQGQYYKEGARYAKNSIESDPNEALLLWKALVDQGQNEDQAIQAAAQSSPSDAYFLWKALFAKGLGFEAFSRTIQPSHIEQPDRSILALSKVFIESNQSQDCFLRIAENGFHKKELSFATLQLWEALFKKGIGYPEALKVAERLLKGDISSQYAGLLLLKTPLKNGYGHELAGKAIEKLRHQTSLQTPLRELEQIHTCRAR